MKQLTFVLLVLLLLVGCRKDTLQDRLEGEATNLVGKWEWVYSLEEIVGDIPPSTYDTITPTIAGFTYQVEIFAEGLTVISKDGTELGQYRMEFDGPSSGTPGRVAITGKLYRAIGTERISFSAAYFRISPDTMEFWYHPLDLEGNSGNIFKRIQ